MKPNREISEITAMNPSTIDLGRIAFDSTRNAIRKYAATL